MKVQEIKLSEIKPYEGNPRNNEQAIAERLHTKGQEPTTDEARFAATFVNSVKVETVIRWLEQLMDVMECDEDRCTVGRLIANLKG